MSIKTTSKEQEKKKVGGVTCFVSVRRRGQKGTMMVHKGNENEGKRKEKKKRKEKRRKRKREREGGSIVFEIGKVKTTTDRGTRHDNVSRRVS